ncbi:MAG TPA: glycosyltransferase family 2 protein [Caldimonas sp.]|nr:glycosyltransferase family 2 protein [Caldimonas sp.]
MSRAVFVVIVNYRTPELALACLGSLAGQRSALQGGRVLVVDNDSGDDSIASIVARIEAERWTDWVELLPMPRNGGFAYGNNAGIARARALDPAFAVAILLNPDTVVAPGCIDALAGFLEAHRDVGIAGAAIANPEGARERSAHRWPSPLGELEGAAQLELISRALRARAVSPELPDGVTRCDWVSGACLAMRREVIDAIGPLDEGYFLYFEEVDFCRRAQLAGWACAYVPQARVVHHEGASTGIRTGRRRRPGYWYASRRRFFVKAYGVTGLIAGDLLWAVGRATLVLRRIFGLGGRAGFAREPSRFALDLLGGDIAAMFRGELRGIPRMAGHGR